MEGNEVPEPQSVTQFEQTITSTQSKIKFGNESMKKPPDGCVEKTSSENKRKQNTTKRTSTSGSR